MHILEMHGIRKSFGATRALDGVDFAVAAGEVHALVGENGAGKSTLMKILSGAISPDDGQLYRDGKRYQPLNPQQARRAGVAMIYQELSLAPHLTVEENIMLGSEPTRHGLIRREEIRSHARKALQTLNHPEILPQMRVNKLSLAGQQLVEIARALATGCRVLVLDEPTSALSYQDIQKLFEIIKNLKEHGKAIIYISHFLEEVKQVSDRFTVLRDGRTVGGGVTADCDIHEIVRLMVGRQIGQLYPRSSRTPGEPLLQVRNLGGVTKPDLADFTLYAGEVLGIAGLVGAGRSELLRTIFGLDPVKHGQISVGAFIGRSSPVQAWAQGVGLLSEDRGGEGLALSLNIADNITLSNLKKLGPLHIILPAKQKNLVRQLTERLDIRCRDPQQQVWQLSGGNQQKVAIARLLYHDVDIFLLDEPTRGIDVASKAQIYQLIDEIVSGKSDRTGQKRAVLMVSSYLPELLGMCDRIAVMCRGRLAQAHPVEEFNEHSLMVAATGQG